MKFIPTQVVKDSLWIRLFLLFQLCIQLLLRGINKLAMIGQLLDKVIHRRNVSTEQLVDAAIFLILWKS